MSAKVNDLDKARDLVRVLNQRHGAQWTLAGRLEGGFQQGAFRLVAPHEELAVLKLFHTPSAERLASTAHIVERARKLGWRTPTWRAWGLLDDHLAYCVTDYLSGPRLRAIDSTSVEQVLSVIDRQADQQPDTDQDWSSYAWRVVYRGESGFAGELIDFSREGRKFVELVDALTSSYSETTLPTGDLVHGDLLPGNMILVDGSPWVIDVHAAGKGTRTYDVARLISSTKDERVRARLIEYAARVTGKGALLICLAANVLGIAAFGVSHWPEDVDGYLGGAGLKLQAVHELNSKGGH